MVKYWKGCSHGFGAGPHDIPKQAVQVGSCLCADQRSFGNISTIYFARVSTTPADPIKAGTVVTSSGRYKVGYFPAGAEASLASL